MANAQPKSQEAQMRALIASIALLGVSVTAAMATSDTKKPEEDVRKCLVELKFNGVPLKEGTDFKDLKKAKKGSGPDENYLVWVALFRPGLLNVGSMRTDAMKCLDSN